jgi:paraquat-inducible protein A
MQEATPTIMPTQGSIGLLVCEQCDAVHRKSPMHRGEVAECTRCGARLERAQRLTPNGMLAMTVAAAIMFALANLYPIVRVDVRGVSGTSTFWGAVMTAWNEDSHTIAVLAAVTVFVAPLIELLAAGYVLWPLARGRRPLHFAPAMRVLRGVRAWSMPEVFLLGAIVALVKLGGLATVIPDAGLWAFGALTWLITLVTSFDHHWLWDIAAQADA